MFTLGYSFRPWEEAEAIADGPSIRSYIRETARDHGVEDRVRFHHRVVAAEWSTDEARWTVEVERTDTQESLHLTCGFLFMCTGYYRYDEGYTPHFEGRERFGGEIVHPQHWPEGLDYAGKRVVVIGSGATAVTLVPGDGRGRRARDDGAALAELRGLAARNGPARGPAAPRAPREGAVSGGALEERPPDERVLHRLPPLADVHEGSDPQGRGEEPPGRLRRGHPLRPALPALGPAPLPRPRRRPVRVDQRRQGVDRDRPDRDLHREGAPARVGRRARGRPDHHRDRAQHAAARRDARSRSTGARSSSRRPSATRG